MHYQGAKGIEMTCRVQEEPFPQLQMQQKGFIVPSESVLLNESGKSSGCELGILLHQVNNFIVHLQRCIQSPDEIQVCPFRNLLVIDKLLNFRQ